MDATDKQARRRGLLDTLPQTGTVEWIGLSPGTRQPITVVDSAVANPGTGLEGDYHNSVKRQVTLIQKEHLPVIAALSGLAEVSPEMMRRNLVVSGINLTALENHTFRVGSAILKGVEACDPCHRIEETLGAGGFNAAAGMGGLIADVVEAGGIAIGDAVSAVISAPQSE